MAESLLVRKGGGGDKIEEVIQQYKVASGETVTAGTFVDFIDETAQDIIGTDDAGGVVATKLTDTQVLVAYKHFNGSQQTIRLRVVVFNGSSITIGNPTTITRDITFTSAPDLIRLSNTTALFVGFQPSGNEAHRMGITISGDAITHTANDNLQQGTTLNEIRTSAFRISDNTAIATFGNTANSLEARIITYNAGSTTFSSSGTTVTVDNANNPSHPSITQLTSSLYVIVYRNDGNSYGMSRVFTVSGTTITFSGTSQFFSGGIIRNQVKGVIATPINSTSILVNYYRLALPIIVGQILTFNTTQQTAESRVFIFGNRFYNKFEVFLISNNKYILLAQSAVNPTGLYEIYFSINNNDIIFEKEVAIPNTVGAINGDLSFMNDQYKILSHYAISSGQKLGVKLIEINRLKNATTKINGLAKKGGTAGQTIEVFVNE
jgi:hypothetical protein